MKSNKIQKYQVVQLHKDRVEQQRELLSILYFCNCPRFLFHCSFFDSPILSCIGNTFLEHHRLWHFYKPIIKIEKNIITYYINRTMKGWKSEQNKFHDLFLEFELAWTCFYYIFIWVHIHFTIYYIYNIQFCKWFLKKKNLPRVANLDSNVRSWRTSRQILQNLRV